MKIFSAGEGGGIRMLRERGEVSSLPDLEGGSPVYFTEGTGKGWVNSSLSQDGLRKCEHTKHNHRHL